MESKSLHCLTRGNEHKAMADKELVQVKCRHSAGDIGPWSYGKGANVQAVKEQILNDWPTGSIRLFLSHSVLEQNPL